MDKADHVTYDLLNVNFHLIHSGHYWYIEASAPRKQGDKARLLTLAMNARPNGTCSMRFFYHMNGDYDEGLRVYVLKENDGLLDLRFKDTKNYGDMWKQGVVDLSKDTGKFRLVFEGNEIFIIVRYSMSFKSISI